MAKSAPLPGTSDIFPAEIGAWRFLENTARSVFERYNYGELRTPIFEATEVFQRGLGDETEVVQKEMYTFDDRGGRSCTLRPEGTAGAMRALLNTDVLNGVEQRVFYIGPMFRGERPAAGRRRQFHQVGVENVGRVAPELDAETIAMLLGFLEELGITGATLKLNTRGVAADRPAAAEALKAYFSKHIDLLCEDCRKRLQGNVWRILDCKVESCRNIIADVPDYAGMFSEESRAYFQKVCQYLDWLGIKYEIDPFLVRGLDYYVHTVFEITHPGLGAQNAIAGGGRYELTLPGESKPVIGVGFAAGMERLLMVREALNLPADGGIQAPPCVFVAALGEAAEEFKFKFTASLRKQGIAAASELAGKSLKAQMRAANRVNAACAVIVGDDELSRQVAVLRDLAGGEQKEVALGELESEIKKLINK
ncbi:MAG: histidine--tRNA ligase [Lentisphaerae bacterium]|nr:histidine--tRNA ligase [Lentisphaerota bacterium]